MDRPGGSTLFGKYEGSMTNTNLVHSRFISKEFDSERAAYEFGLQGARVWIDDHTHTPEMKKTELEKVRQISKTSRWIIDRSKKITE